MQPVAGYVLDILGTKVGYAVFAVLWAIFCAATAIAGSWGGFALARGAVGTAEAAMIPAGLKASSEWFPGKERSVAVGYFNVGSSIGAMLAPLVVWADRGASLADGLYHHWRAESNLGALLAGVL
ncbi:Hexuronate transporter|nr:Hexuronate transporter [Candidatus Pantoea persica]